MLLFFRNFFGLFLKNTIFLGIINKAGGADYAFIYVITMITASIRYRPKIVIMNIGHFPTKIQI